MTPAGDDNSSPTEGSAGTRTVDTAEEAARTAEAAAEAAERAAEHADESAEDAGDAAQRAGAAAEQADLADASAEQSARRAASAEAAARQVDGVGELQQTPVGDLLIDERHPSEGMGAPGPPLRRSNPFVFGFFAALGVLVAWGLWNALGQAKSVIILLVVSMFIAVGLNPLVEWFMRRGLRRGFAVGVVFLLMILAVAGVGFAIVPVVSEQINNLIENAPDWLNLLNNSKTVNDLDNRYHFIQKATEYVQDPALAQRAFGGILGVGKVVANALFNTFTILILTLYFLASLPSVKRAAYSLVPATRRPRVSILGDQVLSRVGGYVSGQFLVALCAGVFMFIFLEIVGLRDYAVALAIVVMFTAFIPMVGGLIGCVIITAIGFTDGLWVGIACLAYGVIYQQVENYVIAPRIMRRAVDIPGAVTVVAALLGGALLGVVGALLAIPSAAALLLIIREVWVRKADAS
ncbi:putative PurR-regulated permease PerM [Kribbella amoyensis]|uniref:Putative PurR-regulated permease PerM n=1 Tax=Kribbella amoyensis TaxID=996641 RepID=A0A561B8I6_9ACTN|nr:AI-2E family transporter [Kribbella amoyensis]TWD75275.1 putative PurR-regulated permease PerM [Kribbella amoyensis]